MYAISIGEKKLRVVDKEDAKTLNEVLFDLDCSEKVSSKLIKDDEKEENND